jgi:NADP-dependent 3-hydroxy acid dehydrogenase YdfG
MSANDTRVWVITGCSSPFGREFARAAFAHGFPVVATVRDAHKLDDLMVGYQGHARSLTLDVTNAEQIRRAVSDAEDAFGRDDSRGIAGNAGTTARIHRQHGIGGRIRRLPRLGLLRSHEVRCGRTLSVPRS